VVHKWHGDRRGALLYRRGASGGTLFKDVAEPALAIGGFSAPGARALAVAFPQVIADGELPLFGVSSLGTVRHLRPSGGLFVPHHAGALAASVARTASVPVCPSACADLRTDCHSKGTQSEQPSGSPTH